MFIVADLVFLTLFFMPFCRRADFFQNQLFWNILSGIPSECQTDWIWVQSVCLRYQQRTLGDKELNVSQHFIIFKEWPSILQTRGPSTPGLLTSFLFKVKKKGKIRNRYNQVPHLTQDTIWESDKDTRKHHTRESQEVSPFPAGDHKAARNRQDKQETQITERIYKWSTAW